MSKGSRGDILEDNFLGEDEAEDEDECWKALWIWITPSLTYSGISVLKSIRLLIADSEESRVVSKMM